MDASVLARFWSYVDKEGPWCEELGSRCWQWTGYLSDKGYGLLNVGGTPRRAHRISLGMVVDLGRSQVDHRCFNHACVSPSHLRKVTHKQNQENRQGARQGSVSGVRGVTWNKRKSCWQAFVRHNGQQLHVGYYLGLDAAERAVIKRRNELFTHNDRDRCA